MANKTFVVQYLIKAREQYVAIANKVAASTNKMRKQIKKSSAAFKGLSSVVRKTGALVKRAVGAMAAKTSVSGSVMRGGIAVAKVSFSALAATARGVSAVVKGSMRAMATGVSVAMNKIRGAAKRAKQSIIKVGEGAKSAGKKLILFATLPLALLANSLKNSARDAEETDSKFGTVFSSIRGKADAMALNLSKNFGLARDEAKGLLANTGDLLSGFGFSQKATLAMSNDIVKLGADLASFSNFEGGAEGASIALTKALLGETESAKALGIVIRQGTPTFKKNVAMIQRTQRVSLLQAKAIEILRIASTQSKNAIGDFARTQEDLANQERITLGRLRDLRVEMGKFLLPIALKINKVVQNLTERFLALSPRTKKIILIVAGVVAVLGPLLLLFGGLILLFPALTAGFAVFTAVMGPLLLPVLLFAAAAALVIKHWEEVKAFFKGFGEGFQEAMGPTLTNLIEQFKEAAGIIASLFASDSEAATNLREFADIGKLIGTIVGGALKLLINGLSGIGEILGQVIGSLVTLDFSAFDVGRIKAQFLGEQAQLQAITTSPVIQSVANPPTRVDVGVQVGLDKGLKETAPTAITQANTRRTDVGLVTGG